MVMSAFLPFFYWRASLSVFWFENHKCCVFGVKKSGISAFLVSAENGENGVDKMTNITLAVSPNCWVLRFHSP